TDADKEKRVAAIQKEIADLQAKIAKLQAELVKLEPKHAGPITVRLTAKQAAYVLDRQGMTTGQYREAIKEGKIAPPAVDLVLEITNRTKADMDITVAGASPRLTLDLRGKDGVEKLTRERTPNKTLRIILKAGETHSIPIQRLAGYSSRTTEDQL